MDIKDAFLSPLAIVLSAIRVEGELKAYYERQVAKGKNKMSVLKAVRNKRVPRVDQGNLTPSPSQNRT